MQPASLSNQSQRKKNPTATSKFDLIYIETSNEKKKLELFI